MSRYTPPFPPYDPKDPKGFSFDTVVKRWPVILTGIINDILAKQETIRVDETSSPNDRAAALTEGSDIVRQVSRIKAEMSRDYAMPKIDQDDGPNVEEFNFQLAALGENASWFKAPWLYAECYLYRLLRTYFARTRHWHQHDPFLEQKNKTFRSSSAAVYKLAASLLDLDAQKEKLLGDEATLKALFGEMLHMCLWGNATDLSLLTNMTQEDIQKLQTVTKDEQAERAQYILLDNGEQAWEQLRKSHERVDVILDNGSSSGGGFWLKLTTSLSGIRGTLYDIAHHTVISRLSSRPKLYTDLILAEFLISFMGVQKVIFHPKALPWFVSDVTPPDFKQTISILQKADEWSSEQDTTGSSFTSLAKVATRFQERIASGVFELSVSIETKLGQPVPGSEYEFWTGPSAYYYMKDEAPRLFEHLAESSLVIFKGDLNYRKLTGDVKWPVSTPFNEAIGPLKGAFPILSLRTNKADVAVGVQEEVARKLEADGIPWRTNGKYALISFEPKA